MKNPEPEKHTDWGWVKWDELVSEPEEELFLPFKYFFEQGFKDL